MNVKHLLVLSLVLFVSLSVVIAADKEKTKSLIETVLGKIIDNHEKNVAKANNKYQKSIAPIVERHNKRRIASIKKANVQTINKLNNLIKEANRKKEILSVEIIKKQIETIKKNNKSLENVPSVNRMWRIEYKDHYYLAISAPITWTEANKICKNMGGHLVYIETKDEMDFVLKLSSNANVYVGATDTYQEGKWLWGNKKKVNISFWSRKQRFGGKKQNAAYLRADGLGDVEFDKYYIDVISTFVCEWDN